MAAMQDLVEEVERSYAETQERMSDPSVYTHVDRFRRASHNAAGSQHRDPDRRGEGSE